jgi:RHS repeat-associated protein
VRRFDYDAIYRLTSATGRECRNLDRPEPWFDDSQRCGFNGGNHGTPNQDNAPDLTAVYRETYAYDPAGNMSELRHGGGSGIFLRRFDLVPDRADPTGTKPLNNRLRRVTVGQTPFDYIYDDNGNLVSETTSRHFEWDHGDWMKAFRVQAGESEPSIHTHYLYDAGGQRVKKLVRRQGGHFESTTVIDSVFEHQRWQGNDGQPGENNSLHVMDDQQRIALVRAGPAPPDDAGPVVQYHLGDHLGSSSLVVDQVGNFINREEYTANGETSFGSFAKKRYRFTGKERDEESRLYYHGLRYYAPWVARWASCDPAESLSPTNLYAYVRNNPMRNVDPTGLQSTDQVGQYREGQVVHSDQGPVFTGKEGALQDLGPGETIEIKSSVDEENPFEDPPIDEELLWKKITFGTQNFGQFTREEVEWLQRTDPEFVKKYNRGVRERAAEIERRKVEKFLAYTNGAWNFAWKSWMATVVLAAAGVGVGLGSTGAAGSAGAEGLIVVGRVTPPAIGVGLAAEATIGPAGEVITSGGAPRISLSRPAIPLPNPVETPLGPTSGIPNFEEGSVSPGKGWEWRGRGAPGTSKGAWYNPATTESLHPDLAHGDPIGPHYDYRAPNGTFYRIYPGGRVEPK